MKVLKMFKSISIILVIAMLFTSLSPVAVYAGDGEVSSLEAMIGKMFTGIANGINWLISKVLGRMVSIDDFVFNNYPDTKIDFFMTAPPGESGVGKEDGKSSVLIWGKKGDGKGGLAETINQWYSIFQKMAIMVYMIMLVYMGIRIMLSSTGENLAQYKTLFMYWVAGVVMLFFYPYVIKYVIKMNDAFVETVEGSKNGILAGVTIGTPSAIDTSHVEDLSELDFSESPFDGTGTDYMSEIARDADETGSLALGLTYLILTWQLITLAIHYYKRILMVGFLIAIFPIVMTFYVLDKVGDGKSQSFTKWNKEFIVNVFIQSFHAIVYIFVVGTIYSAKTPGGMYDYVLVITGATFLFTGEEIIKKIFSQESPSVKSLAATAAGAMAVATAVKGAAKAVTAPVTSTANAVNRVRTASAQAKAAGVKLNVADKLGLFTATSAPNAGLRLDGAQAEMARIDADTSLSDQEKADQKAEVTRVANAAAAVNNPQSRSAQELADAYRVLQQAKGTPIGDAVMNGSNMNLTQAQLDDMSAMQSEVAAMAAAGTDKVEIDRHLQLRLGYTLAGMSEEDQNRYRRMLLADMALRGASRYPNPKQSAHDEVEATMRELSGVAGSFAFGSKSAGKDERSDLRREATEFAKSMYLGKEGGPTDHEKDLARSVLIIKRRGAGVYDASEYMSHLNKIMEAEKDGTIDPEVAQKMISTLDVDPEVLRHALAARLQGDPSIAANKNTRTQAAAIVSEMAGDASREGYFDDEVSAHELLSAMSIEDESARNAKLQEIEDRIASARVAANEVESSAISDIAADLLAEESADVGYNVLTEGELDTTTEYFEGHTREEYLEAQRRAKRNVVLSFIGGSMDEHDSLMEGMGFERKGDPTASYSEEYIRNQQAKNAHFYGDHPNK